MRRLGDRGLRTAVRELCGRDPVLAASVARHGPPPLWPREPGFSTLVHIVLEQQVSLASAQAAFDRLGVAIGEVTPERFLGLSHEALRTIGFSRQKAGYVRRLAAELLDGFSLEGLERLPDEAARGALLALHGVGPWTADIYLLMVLRRPDVWPHGDQALATAAREVLGLGVQPTFTELSAVAERWRPHRASAARILWHDYLSTRGRT